MSTDDRILIVDHDVICGTAEAQTFTSALYSVGLPVGARTQGSESQSLWAGITFKRGYGGTATELALYLKGTFRVCWCGSQGAGCTNFDPL